MSTLKTEHTDLMTTIKAAHASDVATLKSANEMLNSNYEYL